MILIFKYFFDRIRSRTPDTEKAPAGFGFGERVWSTNDTSQGTRTSSDGREADLTITDPLGPGWDALPECTAKSRVSCVGSVMQRIRGYVGGVYCRE